MSSDALPTGGGRRMEARRRKRRQQRQRLVAGGVVLALALVVGIVVLVTRGGGDGGDGGPAVATRTQQTLLLQVRGGSGATTSNVLLAQDPANGDGAALLVPPQVLASPPGSQAVPFGQVLRTTSVPLARNALADLIGVTIDASWVLTTSGLATLVDQLGGISVDVDVQVVGGTNGRQVLLTPGTQQLSGGQALAFAGYLASGEQEQSRLARLQEVLDGVLDELPDAPQLRSRLEGLGTRSVVNGFDVARLSSFLLALKQSSADEQLQYDTLPVITVETGAATPSLRVDPDAVRGVVDRLLAASVPPGVREGNNRVKVFNGVGTPMLGNVVRDRLVKAGLVFVGSANASSFGIARTEIQIGDPTPEALALGNRVAAALGVPASAVRSSDPTSVADVIVVIGRDFQAAG